MTLKIHNFEQGTNEWFAARLGIPTASRFADVISKGRGTAPSKTRRTYMMKLLAERITGNLQQNHTNEHTARGHEHEDPAREAYMWQTDNHVEQVGFIVDYELGAGYSPDGLVDDDGLIEIKSKLPHLHLDVLLGGEVPKEHIAQIQGGLLVSKRNWCDFVSYCPDLPLFVKTVHRDEKMIERLRAGLVSFNEELQQAADMVAALEVIE